MASKVAGGRGSPDLRYSPAPVEVKRPSDPAFTPLLTPIQVVDSNGNVSTRNPVGGKFFFLPFTSNIGNLLALWDTTGDDLWIVRLQIFDLADNFVDSDSHLIQLDNTGPQATIEITTGVGNCGKFNIGVMLAGNFVARDIWFGSYSLTVKPPVNPPGVGVPVPSGGTVQTSR